MPQYEDEEDDYDFDDWVWFDGINTISIRDKKRINGQGINCR